jgi:hypothetical protein
MQKNIARSLAVAALFWSATPTIVLSQGSGLMQEEADCEGDAFQFCGQYIPNHDQIRDCLVANQNQISPACRAIVAPDSRR